MFYIIHTDIIYIYISILHVSGTISCIQITVFLLKEIKTVITCSQSSNCTLCSVLVSLVVVIMVVMSIFIIAIFLRHHFKLFFWVRPLGKTAVCFIIYIFEAKFPEVRRTRTKFTKLFNSCAENSNIVCQNCFKLFISLGKFLKNLLATLHLVRQSPFDGSTFNNLLQCCSYWYPKKRMMEAHK